jgi:FkbM family methyltransferase
MFFRVKDVISISPVLRGTYEPQMDVLFGTLCGMGWNEFLLDIGANIGLTINQNGSRFGVIFAYEPNPTAFAVLTANCQHIDKSRLRLFQFGIGTRDEVMEMCIPKDNLGGGYIPGKGNNYDEQTIAAKDSYSLKAGSSDCGDTDYYPVTVQLKCGSVLFSEIFKTLLETGKRSGVIKIDVEGYEMTILRELAACQRNGIEFVAVFENWNQALAKQDVLDTFAGLGFLYKLEWNMEGKSTLNRLWRMATQGERFAFTDDCRSLAGTVIYSTKPLI